MITYSFLNLGLASAIALFLSGAAAVAQTASPPERVQRPVRVVTQPPAQPAAKPILVLPPSALRQAMKKTPMPVVNTNLKLLTDAEKLAMVKELPGGAAVPASGVISSAVLTPIQPYLPNQASIVQGGPFNGLEANGEFSLFPPHWSMVGTGVYAWVQFLPFESGQLTFVVFHVAHLDAYRDFKVNGYKATAVDRKVVLAVTPDSTEPMLVSLTNVDGKQRTMLNSVEIFVVK